MKAVAEMCRKIGGPSVNIIPTTDEIPNTGYTLSNVKLLSTGFTFRYNLEDSLTEMIHNWSCKYKQEPVYKFGGSKLFSDSRGVISNYELPEVINMVGVIESVRGSVRANHYHPIQEQKCILLYGQYISVYIDLSDPTAVMRTQVVNAGDCEVISPNVAHAMVFTDDSMFINLVRGEREHENYGVTHTIPYELVDDELRDILLASYKTECRVCLETDLQTYVSFGLSPLANSLPSLDNPTTLTFPLEVNYCPQCHNSQLTCAVPPKLMFDHYLYTSSTTETMRVHFGDAATSYVKLCNLDADSLVVDIGSNDGVTLGAFRKLGITAVGVDPAKNLADLANSNNLPTIPMYFGEDAIQEIKNLTGRTTADLILASNTFAHADDLHGIASNVRRLLHRNGTFIIEVQYLFDTIRDLSFDNIYHEHYNYWLVTSLGELLSTVELEIVGVESIDTHGGSIRVYIRRNDADALFTNSIGEDRHVIDPSVYIQRERDAGLLSLDRYVKFGEELEQLRHNVIRNIRYLWSQGRSIIGYGSPAKATTALNYFDIGTEYIDYIVDDNPLKQGKYLPGVVIPIRSKEELETTIDHTGVYILIMAWNFAAEIINNNTHLNGGKVKFLTIYDLRKSVDEFTQFIDSLEVSQ